MRKLILFLTCFVAATAFGQDVPIPPVRTSPMPIGKVRKVYVRVDLYHGLWRSLGGLDPEEQRRLRIVDAKPKGHLRERLMKDLAGTCIEIVESAAEADANLGLDYREPENDGSGFTTCRSTVIGASATTTCTGGGIWTTGTYTPYGGYSMSGPIVFQELVLYDAQGDKIGNWSLSTDYRPSHKDLADELVDAVGCGGGAE